MVNIVNIYKNVVIVISNTNNTDNSMKLKAPLSYMQPLRPTIASLYTLPAVIRAASVLLLSNSLLRCF